MKIEFYPLDFSKSYSENETFIILYSKQKNGSKIVVKEKFEPYCYLSTQGIDVERLESMIFELKYELKSGRVGKVISKEKCKRVLRGKKLNLWKLRVNFPETIKELVRDLGEKGVEFYETDLTLTQQYIKEKDLTPTTLVQAKGVFEDENDNLPMKKFRVPLFIANNVELVKEIGNSKEDVLLSKLKILAIDIETYNKTRAIDMQNNPILMVALYGVDEKNNVFEKVLTWREFDNNLVYVEHLSDENEMLKRFGQLFEDFDPDIITGYFSDGFDLPYIKTRADKLGVKFDFGLDYSGIEVSLRRHLSNGWARVGGRVHIDIFKFVRNIFGKNWKIESYNLNSVGKEVLGEEKLDVDISKLARAWDENKGLDDFCKYNLQDAKLTFRLAEKLMPSMLEFSRLLDLPLFAMIRMKFARLVESFLLKYENKYNLINPNKPSEYEISARRGVMVQGAFVFEPKPGIYENVVVFDFLSLYPTIIISHNIAGESLKLENIGDKNKVPGHNYWYDTTKKAFIPTVLQNIIDKRVALKKELKEKLKKKDGSDTQVLESRIYALKILANSFYGYLGFYAARWYSKESAAAITAYARDYIKTVIKKAGNAGFKVIYSDTDSVMITLDDKNQDQAHKFVEKINKDLPRYMELEFEGFFPRAIFVASKGSERGAKKKYALIDKADAIKIVGFETVRRNWSAIAKKTQKDFLEFVLRGENDNGLEYLRGVIKNVESGKVPLSEMTIKMQITRPLESYKVLPPHVAVAKRMKKKGFVVDAGTLVEFVIEDGKGLVRDRAKRVDEMTKGYDVEYYLKNQIIPAVTSILQVIGVSEDELFAKSSQKGLGSFV